MLHHPLTDEVRLEPLEPWQARQFAEHVAPIRGDIALWVTFADKVDSVATARPVLQGFADMQAKDTGRVYGIWRHRTLVGGVLCQHFDVNTRSCQIGVWLAPQEHGRGLVCAAVRVMIDWAIRVRELRRVEWHTAASNSRSREVAKRLGMRSEGARHSAYTIKGQPHDAQVWVAFAEEWQGGRRPWYRRQCRW